MTSCDALHLVVVCLGNGSSLVPNQLLPLPRSHDVLQCKTKLMLSPRRGVDKILKALRNAHCALRCVYALNGLLRTPSSAPSTGTPSCSTASGRSSRTRRGPNRRQGQRWGEDSVSENACRENKGWRRGGDRGLLRVQCNEEGAKVASGSGGKKGPL